MVRACVHACKCILLVGVRWQSNGFRKLIMNCKINDFVDDSFCEYFSHFPAKCQYTSQRPVECSLISKTASIAC